MCVSILRFRDEVILRTAYRHSAADAVVLSLVLVVLLPPLHPPPSSPPLPPSPPLRLGVAVTNCPPRPATTQRRFHSPRDQLVTSHGLHSHPTLLPSFSLSGRNGSSNVVTLRPCSHHSS